MTAAELADVQKRDAEAAATWFDGPASPKSVCMRDRRALLAAMNERAATTLAVVDGYICELGNLDLGLPRGDSSAVGVALHVPAGDNLQVRGLTWNTANKLAPYLRRRVRVSIELLEGDFDDE